MSEETNAALLTSLLNVISEESAPDLSTDDLMRILSSIIVGIFISFADQQRNPEIIRGLTSIFIATIINGAEEAHKMLSEQIKMETN